jgi:hypothetical protein
MDSSIPRRIGPKVEAVRERRIVLLLCLVAAVHVFVFSAAFPFFNNVDESAHFDLVVKYSLGEVPRGLEAYSPESCTYLGVYASGEYWLMRDRIAPGKILLAPWKQPGETARTALENNITLWQTRSNYEVSMPPLYYAIGGLWWDIGQWVGLEKEALLYWLRFLNVLLVAFMVGLGYFTARLVFPGKIFLRLSVPALIAFLPQSAFYSVGNDILSPVCFGLVFVCLLQWLHADDPPWHLGAATGLAFAATYLAKTTNIPLLMVALTVIMLGALRGFSSRERMRIQLPPLLAFFGCMAPPIIVWTIWCKLHFGDFTGSSLKSNFFGWTVKPLADWPNHPIFSVAGIWTYLSGAMATFWQGEIVWFFQRMTLPAVGTVYTVLSLGLVGVTVVKLFSPSTSASERKALWLSFACFTAILAFFAVMSVAYDFHDCVFPSRDHPYFDAGRLLLGSLIPFLLLFVYGLDGTLARLGNTTKFIVLGVLLLLMLFFEIVADRPVFSSQFNWYHQ